MRFQPMTEEAAQEAGLMEKGRYAFEVADAEDKTSSNGNDMIALKLHVLDGAGNARIVFDYLVEAMAFKLRHAAYACGLGDEYESGTLSAASFRGCAGECDISIQKAKGAYGPKNAVADYVLKEATVQAASKAQAPIAADLDDEIPF